MAGFLRTPNPIFDAAHHYGALPADFLQNLLINHKCLGDALARKTVVDTMASTPDFTIDTASGGRLASYIGPSTLAMIPKPHRTSAARRTASWILGLLPQALLKVVNQQITMYTMLSNPTSEGSVELSSADVHAEPTIRTAGYQTSEEVEAAAKGLAVVSALIQSPSLYKYARSIAELNSTLFRIAGRIYPERVLIHYSQPNKQGSTSPLTFPILPDTNVQNPRKKQKLQSWLNDMHSEGWTYTGTCRSLGKRLRRKLTSITITAGWIRAITGLSEVAESVPGFWFLCAVVVDN
ncbi:hypothetical protein LTR07_010017 [Exophiala xenobiotica]|nr:hypothetical protein LTR41_000756 [Exophiala xenobiotica]KAK5242294.1 hypothetical protein LTS06_011612 [Exophiala xenobiotica]KAK5331444.1 hypothetical protein LTR93_000447 [Exophiala xenobiotica]KAK5408235.1 hypothetical protein LTR90_009691 [Exophiala xenobiotica]KAK5472258.1 hypothetical protein LTR26_010384 [Exophiala xenobiotica]